MLGTGRFRRGISAALGVVTAAAAAVVVGVTGAQPAQANASFSFARLSGADRYDTARLAAEATFQSGASTVLLANGSVAHFPDALTGSYLAGFAKIPILLTDVNTVPAATSQALQELHATTIVVLGGTAAVSQAEYNQLAASYKMYRVAGNSRYDTMQAAAESAPASNVGSTSAGPTAIVASGVNFPDALVSGPIGYAKQFPVLITDPSALSSQTAQTLKDLGIKFVLIPGGSAAVSSAVESQIQAMGITTKRFSGADRTDTAAQVATYAVQTLGFSNSRVDLARGDDPADSLAGGPFGGTTLSPTLLTNDPNTLGTYSGQYLTSNAPTLASGVIFGGTSAVSQAVQSQATQDAQAVAPVPKLSSASLSGATLTLTYSEAVLCSTVDSNGSDYAVSDGSTPDNPTAAACSSPSAQGASATVNLTLPTAPAAGDQVAVVVQKGADGDTVTDPAGNAEPVGDSITTTPTVVPRFVSASAAAGSTTVAVGYSEAITCSSVQAGDFTATVGSTADTVTSATCQGTTAPSVSLTLTTAPTAGQTVTVTAQKGSDGDTVTDQSGQTQPVADTVSTTAAASLIPSILTVTAGGGSSTVTLTYNESIACSSLDSNGSDYTVTDTHPGGSGAADNPTAASCSNPSNGASNTAQLTVPTAPLVGDTIKVTAQNGADGNTVVDGVGAKEVVGDNRSTTAQGPQFTGLSAKAGSTTITVTYNENITCSTVDPADYTVTDAGSSDPLFNQPGCTGTSSNQVTLTVANAPKAGDKVTVTAAKGLDQNTVTDANGYAQNAGDPTSGTAASTPTISGVSATGGSPTVAVTYNEAIMCSSVDANGSDYTVTDTPSGGSGAADNPTAAACANPNAQGASSTVNLTLPSAPKSGDSVTVTAQAGADGNTVLDFNNGQEPAGDHMSGTASTVPQFKSASASPGASTVTVTYNENINCLSVDTNGSDYTVTVGGTSDTVQSASCSPPFGPGVTLTLQTSVGTGQPVVVTAKKGADGDTVTDLSGGTQPVGDTVSTTPSGSVPPALTKLSQAQSNSSFVATFNEAIDATTCDKADFTATYSNSTVTPPVSGQALTVNSITCDNNGSAGVGEANISFGQSVPKGSTVTITSAKGGDGNTVCTTGGTPACEATGDSATSPPTTDFPPAFQGMTTSNTTGAANITLTYNEPILCSTVDSNASDYSISYQPTGGGTTTPYSPGFWSAACSNPSSGYSNQVLLSDAAPAGGNGIQFGAGYTITVTAQGGAPDGDTVCTDPPSTLPPGGKATNCQAVGDHASATTPGSQAPPAPTIQSVSVGTQGPPTATFTVTYSEAVACSSVDLNGSDYTVSVFGGPASQATNASCSGTSSTTVTITWSGAVVTGQSKVCAQKGTDGNTVLAASADATPEPVGDCKTF